MVGWWGGKDREGVDSGLADHVLQGWKRQQRCGAAEANTARRAGRAAVGSCTHRSLCPSLAHSLFHTHRAMRNAPVLARVAATETTAVPGSTPKIAPAVMVRGMAGTARISREA